MDRIRTYVKDGKIIVRRSSFEFCKNAVVYNEQIRKSYDFARGMVYDGKGAHRPTRTGGTDSRTNSIMFINVFQGKLAEFALYNYFQRRKITCTEPDIEMMPLGEWDRFDVKAENLLISVKSTKSGGSLLLLECGDYDHQGRYISTQKGEKPVEYDHFCLVLVKTKRNYKQEREGPDFWRFMENQFFKVQIAGFLSKEDFVNEVIEGGMVIQRGWYFNKFVKVDADNYYCQAVDLIPPEQFVQNLKKRF